MNEYNPAEQNKIYKSAQKYDYGLAARKALSGKWKSAVYVSLLLLAASLICSYILSLFERNTSTAAGIMSFLIGIILNLLLSLVTDGALLIFLSQIRGKTWQITDMLIPVRTSPDRYLIVALISTGCAFICFLPLIACIFLPAFSEVSLMILLIFAVIGAVLYLIVSLNLSQSVFFLLDDENLGAVAAVKQSLLFMRGKKLQLLKLLIPFIGYTVLSVFTLGLAQLWIMPYLMCVLAVFYNKNNEGENT